MIFVYSIRDMFVCLLAKTFGHLSDRAKKIEIYKALTLEHYIYNKVFVSDGGIITIFKLLLCGRIVGIRSTKVMILSFILSIALLYETPRRDEGANHGLDDTSARGQPMDHASKG